MPRRSFALVALAAVAFTALAAAAGARTIAGTARGDVLDGTPRADVLRGLAGDDLLDGRGGRDVLAAGRGNDRVQAFDGSADRIVCAAGLDTVAADRLDAVTRQCEVVSRRISRDRLRNPESQHATEVEPHAVGYGTTIVAAFQVGRMASGGAGAIGWATSRDRGRIWRSGLLPELTGSSPGRGKWERASDPVVAYDAEHGVWLVATLVITPARASGLAVSRSRDGLAWRPPVLVDSATGALAFDKEWVVCDNGRASRFAGRCYLAYSDIRRSAIAVRFSTDGGVSWSAPVIPPVREGGRGVGVVPVVRPNGDLVIPHYYREHIVAVRSTDGGASYAPPVTIGRVSFAQPEGLRAPPLPTAAVDAAGTVFVVWSDCSFRRACVGNDLVLARSRDGATWSQPRRIVPRAARVRPDSLIPALQAHPSASGRLALTWYVLARGRLGVRASSSSDGGRTWARATRLDAKAMPFSWLAEAGGAMVGDYIATVVTGEGRAVSVFALAGPRAGRRNEAIFAASLPMAR